MFKYSLTPWFFSFPKSDQFKFYAVEGLFIIDEGKTKWDVVFISLLLQLVYYVYIVYLAIMCSNSGLLTWLVEDELINNPL